MRYCHLSDFYTCTCIPNNLILQRFVPTNESKHKLSKNKYITNNTQSTVYAAWTNTQSTVYAAWNNTQSTVYAACLTLQSVTKP